MKPLKRNHLFIPSRFEDKFEQHALERYQKKNRKRLSNRDFTILSNSCIGAQTYRDLNLRFDTPFVGSYMTPEDFVLFLTNPKKWVNEEFAEEKAGATCPVGILGGKIRIFFVSDKSFEEGVNKWRYRSERIHWDNLFIMFNPLEQDFGMNPNYKKHMCDVSIVKDFLELPFKNKVVISNKKAHQLSNQCVFTWKYRWFEYPPYVGIISCLSGKRIFDRYFDVVHWLNTGEIKKRFSL